MFVIVLLGVISLCACQNAPESTYVLCFDSEVFVVGDQSSKYIDTSGISCERYNDSIAYMYGQFEILEDIDGDLICEVILQKEESGKHQIVFSLDICDICKELGDEASDYRPYLKYMGMPTNCPLKAGVIPINNLVVDMEPLEIKDQHCGPYVAEIIMHKKTGDSCKNDREPLFHVKMDMSIERH